VLPEQIGQGVEALRWSKVVLEHRRHGAHTGLVCLCGRLDSLDATDVLMSGLACKKDLAQAKLTSMQLHAGKGVDLRHSAARRKCTSC